jgi:hypothetical protein
MNTRLLRDSATPQHAQLHARRGDAAVFTSPSARAQAGGGQGGAQGCVLAPQPSGQNEQQRTCAPQSFVWQHPQTRRPATRRRPARASTPPWRTKRRQSGAGGGTRNLHFQVRPACFAADVRACTLPLSACARRRLWAHTCTSTARVRNEWEVSMMICFHPSICLRATTDAHRHQVTTRCCLLSRSASARAAVPQRSPARTAAAARRPDPRAAKPAAAATAAALLVVLPLVAPPLALALALAVQQHPPKPAQAAAEAQQQAASAQHSQPPPPPLPLLRPPRTAQAQAQRRTRPAQQPPLRAPPRSAVGTQRAWRAAKHQQAQHHTH